MVRLLEFSSDRLVLRQWREADRAPLAEMLADAEVMHDYPAPLSRVESDAKLDRYAASLDKNGFGRMLVETKDRTFLGYVGIMRVSQAHQSAGMPDGVEIGWRLIRRAWGLGYASEAARAALVSGFTEFGFECVWAITSPSNQRSQRVMGRIGMVRQSQFDFESIESGQRYEYVVFSINHAQLAQTLIEPM